MSRFPRSNMRAVDKHKQNPGDGVDAEFVRRMLDGESLLRLWRDHRGLTQQALADAANVNRVLIAQIEKGRKTGSVDTLKALAGALEIAVDDLIA